MDNRNHSFSEKISKVGGSQTPSSSPFRTNNLKGAFKKSGEDNRHGAVNWTHIDNSQITHDHTQSPFAKKGYVTAEKAGEWKKFSSFEVQDHKYRMRD
jgi:hypothetical protein